MEQTVTPLPKMETSLLDMMLPRETSRFPRVLIYKMRGEDKRRLALFDSDNPFQCEGLTAFLFDNSARIESYRVLQERFIVQS